MLFLPRISYGGAPSWTTSNPTPDGIYRYYVGRAVSKSDEAEAFTQASRNAFEQAIRENFGFETEIRSQSYETTKDALLMKSITDLSRRVRLQDFEQKDSFKELSDGEIKVWILFQYKIKAIEKEKLRLLNERNESNQFQEGGNPLDAAAGTLEVISEPPGASVFIDGTLINILKTPLRIYGQITPGPHTIKIDHPTYETTERQFAFELGRPNSVRVELKKAMGKIKINSTPDEATILINGKKYGKTPSSEIELPAGVPVRLELLLEGAEKLAQEIAPQKNTTKELNLQLTLKPASIYVSSLPAGAEIKISGRNSLTAVTPTDWLTLEPGSYRVEVEKSGYEIEHEDFTLKGGEKRTLKTFELKEKKSALPALWDSTSEKAQNKPYKRTSDAPSNLHPYKSFLFGFSFFGMSTTLEKLDQGAPGLGASLEFKLTDGVGLVGEYFYKESTGATFSNGKLTSVGSGGRLGLSFYSSYDTKLLHSWMFTPEIIFVDSQLKVERNGEKKDLTKVSQIGYGASIGGIGGFKRNEESGISRLNYRFGCHQFDDSNGFKGAFAFTFSLGVLFGK